MKVASRESRAASGQTSCLRCGSPAISGSGSESARPFRRAKRGFCTPCAVCSFFQDENENHGIGFALPADFDPQGLLLPHIQQQFARVLEVGNSELTMEEIDWDQVIENWGAVSVASPEPFAKLTTRLKARDSGLMTQD
jgi:hypothetical protein